MSFDLIEIWNKMGPFAIAIVVTLGVMAMASMAVFVERLWVSGRSRQVSRRFAARASALLAKRAHDGFIAEAETHRASHLAGMLAGGMRTYLGAVKQPGELGAVELTRRELNRRAE